MAFAAEVAILVLWDQWLLVENLKNQIVELRGANMKILDNANAPNPRRVRIFLAEKGIEVPFEQVDLKNLEQQGEAFSSLNPMQLVPVLILDDDTVITESNAICRYFEELHPTPSLMGHTALEKAQIDMWNWRTELHYFYAVRQAFRHLHPGMKEREVPQVPEWGEANKPKAIAFLQMLDDELKTRDFVAGPNFSIADITALVAFDLMKLAKIELPDELQNVAAWYERVSSRPSAKT